jgi:uncharacterized protein (TIGR02996 family)
MNDHDALLHAIAEHPEEDTPRLMYADWLEENGQPERADFVRNQVGLGQIGIDDPARRPLVQKNVRYLMNFVPQWKVELPQIPGVEWGDFNRGLIEEVQATTEQPIIDHATEIFAVPGIHVLRLRWLGTPPAPHGLPRRTSAGEKLARVAELIRLRVLRLVAARAQAGTLRDLLASPHLGKLTALDLHGNRADDSVAEDIADGRFPDLAELWLGNNQVGADGALALAQSPHLTKLRLLDLSGNRGIDHATRTALKRRFGSALKV